MRSADYGPKWPRYYDRLLAAKLDAALVAAAFEDELPGPAAHPSHKAVHAATVAFLGLVGSLWHE